MIVLVVIGICVVFIGLPVGLVLLILHLQKSDLTKAWEKAGHRHGGHLAQGNEHGGSRLLCLKPWGNLSLVHVAARAGSTQHPRPGDYTHAAAFFRPGGASFLQGSAWPLLVDAQEIGWVRAWQGVHGLEAFPAGSYVLVEPQQLQIVMPGVVTLPEPIDAALGIADALAFRAQQGGVIQVRPDARPAPGEPYLRVGALA
ncbi:MAG: hypothetical protein KC731_35375 [Myxococcales bacterium]|nr:hypothetical protein [Myxococcales bacterium]